MAEIDFLVVLKGLVLVVEVKGGRISRHDGVWRFTDRFGHWNEKREGPFDQARTAMFALEHSLQVRLPTISSLFGYAVITPNQPLGRDLEWDPPLHIGPDAMTLRAFEAALKATIRYWRNKVRNPPSGLDYPELLKLLRPDFDRVPKLSLLSGAMEEDYIALAAQQYDILRGAESNERIFCTGGAGAGKTLLAVETARRAAQSGHTVLLTCRSEGVVGMMKRSLDETSVVCLPYAEATGQGHFDVLVVDEAQDLMTIDQCLNLDDLVKGGLKDGRWRMFSDPNNQANIDGAFDKVVYEELRSQSYTYELPYNCRNTPAVVQQTQLMTHADLGVAKAGHGPAVEYRKCATDEESANLLDAELKRLRGEEIDLSDVVVITLRDSVGRSSGMLTKAKARGTLAAADGATERTDHVARLMTVQSFKGLEAAHVLVIDVDDVSTPQLISRLYVAMTRPRVSLWLAVRTAAWQQLTEGARETST